MIRTDSFLLSTREIKSGFILSRIDVPRLWRSIRRPICSGPHYVEEQIVSKRGNGFRWIWAVGFVLWLGCSEEPATPTAGSIGSSRDESAVEAPIPTDSAGTSSPIAEAPSPVPEALTTEELVKAGRAAYNANCIACHSLDPAQDGALGPAIAGASLALLEARVLRVEYPDGYVPKRTTRVMVPLPHLEPRLVELAAYLESVE